jgi:hypothetical protein
VKNTLILVPALALCAAALADPSSKPAAPPAESRSATAAATPTKVTVVEIDQRVEDATVCRREAPTGSRIITKRCYSKAERELAAADDRAEQERLDELRMLQLYRDQERAGARAEALRRAIER